MNVGLIIGLFNISGFPTFQSGVLRLYSRCAAHLFIYCQLHIICYSYMYHVTETSFSVFYFYYYCLPESEKLSMLISHENLLAVTRPSYQYGPSMSNNIVRK